MNGLCYDSSMSINTHRVVVRDDRVSDLILFSTVAMPESRAQSILRKMVSGDQVEDNATAAVELATPDNAPYTLDGEMS